MKLTRAEEQIMHILWQLEKGFIKDILEEFDDPKPAYTTVATVVKILEKKGFVLPFTLFICGIMILISLSISTLLTKQMYFSQLARDSQMAYYAADNAVACTLSVDETYTDENGMGIFSSDLASSTLEYMNDILASSTERRSMLSQSLLASTTDQIQCAQ